MSKRFRIKLLSFILIASIGLTFGFFFSGLINFALTGLRLPGANDAPTDEVSIAAALAPDAIVRSLRENERHRLLLLGLEFVVICGSAAVLLMGRRETYESDTRPVTDFIETPVAVGQGQHGTARWLKPSERGKTFAVYNLTISNPMFAALLDVGGKDVRTVDNYNEETGKNSGEGKPKNPDSVTVSAPKTAG
jgi:hypothetical protein